jgi:hypothetical protein
LTGKPDTAVDAVQDSVGGHCAGRATRARALREEVEALGIEWAEETMVHRHILGVLVAHQALGVFKCEFFIGRRLADRESSARAASSLEDDIEGVRPFGGLLGIDVGYLV